MSEKIGLGNICIVCNYQGRTLTAVRQHMLAKRHCKIPYESEDERLEISEFYDFRARYANFNSNTTPDNEDDWEDVGSDEAGSDDEDLPQEYLYNDGIELHLPTGIQDWPQVLAKILQARLKARSGTDRRPRYLVAAETRSFLPAFDKKGVQTQQRVWQTERFDKKAGIREVPSSSITNHTTETNFCSNSFCTTFFSILSHIYCFTICTLDNSSLPPL